MLAFQAANAGMDAARIEAPARRCDRRRLYGRIIDSCIAMRLKYLRCIRTRTTRMQTRDGRRSPNARMQLVFFLVIDMCARMRPTEIRRKYTQVGLTLGPIIHTLVTNDNSIKIYVTRSR